MKGREIPRIFTPPLRELTPETSLGFMFIEFCESLGQSLLPWQKWLSIHALEISGQFPDNWSFRFRYIIVLIARQNGKTYWFKLLGLFFNYVLQTKLVIGTGQSLDKSNDTFEEAVDLIESTPMLDAEFVKALRGAGRREYILKNGERWKVVALNRKARGWSSDLILMDEAREMTDWLGWSAVSKTMLARPSALLVTVSNAGDATSVVLRHLRTQAHEQLGDPDKTASSHADLGGEDIDALGLFEWSAIPNCDIHDREQWAIANPSLGYGFLTEKALASACATDPEQVFRTECLCQWVETILPQPFPDGAWDNCLDVASEIEASAELYFGIDMSLDRKWVSIGVCGLREDGNYHIELVARRIGTDWAIDWFRERAIKGKMNLAFQGRGAPVCFLAEQICTIDGITRMAIEGTDLSDGWGRFYDGVANNKIYHLEQPLMDAAAKTMQMRNLGGGIELPDRKKSPNDIAPLYCCIMAHAACTRMSVGNKKIYDSSYANGGELMFV